MKKVQCIKVDYAPVLQWCCDGDMMILKYRRQWIVAILLSIPNVDLQMLYPMAPMPPPMFAYPPPPPPPPPAVAMAFPPSPPLAFQIVQIKTRRNTTGTVEKNGTNTNNNFDKTIGIAIPMAFPGPVQVALPHYRPPLSSIIAASSACMRKPRPSNCPVCPPCSCSPCTPSRFADCSKCHKKCKCPDKKEIKKKEKKSRRKHHGHLKNSVHKAPKANRHEDSDYSYDYSDSYYFDSSSIESTSVEENFKKGKGRYSRKKAYYRTRNFESEINDNDFAKPILSYISDDGMVKLEKLLSDDEAEDLMDESTTKKRTDDGSNVNQNVQVIADEDDGEIKKIKVISNINDDNKLRSKNNPAAPQRRRKKLMIGHLLGEGKKELVFTPPDDKRISNVSLSFQIT